MDDFLALNATQVGLGMLRTRIAYDHETSTILVGLPPTQCGAPNGGALETLIGKNGCLSILRGRFLRRRRTHVLGKRSKVSSLLEGVGRLAGMTEDFSGTFEILPMFSCDRDRETGIQTGSWLG